METTQKEAKLTRLRDITLYHLEQVAPKMEHEAKVAALENLEHDIKVYIKNFLMTCEELHATPTINWVGDNNLEKTSLHTKVGR